MQFKDLIAKAMRVKAAYDKRNQTISGKIWNRENIAQGFVGDVGDLTKLIMAKEGLRKIENADEKLAHELSDCLWSIIILAELYDIDLEKSFMKNMDALEEDIKTRPSQDN